MSVILSVDGLEFRLTFLIAGACSAAAFSKLYRLKRPPPRTAIEDLSTPRRLNFHPLESDIVTFPLLGYIDYCYSARTCLFVCGETPLSSIATLMAKEEQRIIQRVCMGPPRESPVRRTT